MSLTFFLTEHVYYVYFIIKERFITRREIDKLPVYNNMFRFCRKCMLLNPLSNDLQQTSPLYSLSSLTGPSTLTQRVYYLVFARRIGLLLQLPSKIWVGSTRLRFTIALFMIFCDENVRSLGRKAI